MSRDNDEECPRCNGITRDNCTECNGTGIIKKETNIKFATDMEEFLYNERKIMMKERDDAQDELYALKQKSKSTFNVYMYALLEEATQFTWGHPTDNATMIIKKDGQTVTLDPDEIKKVVRTAGGNFKR
jgi:DnaJ-class molecular chaperone